MGLTLSLDYILDEDKFKVDGNIKPGLQKDFVSDFLMTQIGAGEDFNEAETRDVYTIKINLNIESDEYLVEHNCGNKGLRDGILARYIETC